MDFKLMLKAKAEMTPALGHGYNLVGMDHYETPGDELYLIANYSTEAEANKAEAEREKEHPGETVYVYGESKRGKWKRYEGPTDGLDGVSLE